MVMGIFPDLVRKKLRKKLFKKREISGLKFKKLVQQSKETKLRGKEEKWVRVAINLSGKKHKENGPTMKELSSQNNFEVLSIPKEQVLSVLEEGEVPQSQN